MTIEDVVKDVTDSIWATLQMHAAQLREADVVMIVEANLDSLQSNGICFQVRENLERLYQTSVHIFSDDTKAKPGQPRRPGFISTNTRKRACIDKLRQFLKLRSVAISKRFVGREGVDLQQLRYQLLHYEYHPIINRTTGLITNYEYNGKAHGPDDIATILYLSVGIACVYMSTSARHPYRRLYDGNPMAALEDAAVITSSIELRTLKRGAGAVGLAVNGAAKISRL